MFRKAYAMLVTAGAMTVMLGCNPASLSYFLFKGDGKAPADYPIKPPEGKKETTLAILMSAPNAPVEFAGIDRDLARQLGQILTEQSKDKKEKFIVIDQGKIDRFKMTTPGWKTLPPAELARSLGADFLIDAKVTNLSLYEHGTGRLMYQGQASVDVEVTDAGAGQQHSHYFVNTRLDGAPADSVPATQYKTKLIQRIAEELSWKHLPHISDRRVAPSP